MDVIRKILFLISAFTMTAFALPGSAAPAKIFGLVMAPATVTSSTPALTAKFINLTPNGNSVINTVILSPPAGVTATATFPQGGNKVNCPATTVNGSGQTVAVPANSICVANIPSVMKAGCSPTACSWTMNVSATLPNSCSVYTWAGQGFAGNSFNGDVFVFQAANSSVTTSISTQCSINITTAVNPPASGSMSCNPNPVPYNGNSTCSATAATNFTFTGFTGSCTGMTCALNSVTSAQSVTANFVSNVLAILAKPTSASVGEPFDVTIGSTPTGADVSFSTGCTATSAKTLQGDGSTKFTITITTLPAPPSTCTMTFTAPNYNSIALNNLKVYKGVLGCGDYDSINGPSDLFYDPDKLTGEFVGPPGWGLRRGPNKDGATCYKVNYSCDMTANATDNIVSCTWDKDFLPAQQATFKYLFLWAERAPEANGWTSYRPQVSWPPAVPDNTFTFPNWAPLVSCVRDIFSTPPTLILPSIPTDPLFMPVTPPLNTLAQYQPGAVAYVCGAQQGWTAVGAPGTAPGNGFPKIQLWNIIIDEADVTVKGPT